LPESAETGSDLATPINCVAGQLLLAFAYYDPDAGIFLIYAVARIRYCKWCYQNDGAKLRFVVSLANLAVRPIKPSNDGACQLVIQAKSTNPADSQKTYGVPDTDLAASRIVC